MKENIKGFWNLLWLIVSCQICIAIPGEILSLLVKEEYLLSILILALGTWAFCIGVDTYGEIKTQFKK